MGIKGIQIKGKVAFFGNVIYITDFEEMTVDTDKTNRIITADELLKIVNKKEK